MNWLDTAPGLMFVSMASLPRGSAAARGSSALVVGCRSSLSRGNTGREIRGCGVPFISGPPGVELDAQLDGRWEEHQEHPPPQPGLAGECPLAPPGLQDGDTEQVERPQFQQP